MARVRAVLVISLVFSLVPLITSRAQSIVNKLQPRSLETANHQNVAPRATSAAPRIAFGSSRDNGNHDIYTMDADGSNEIRLTTASAYDDQPAWSPDASTIAFMTNRDGNFEIYTMPGTGGTATRLTTNP